MIRERVARILEKAERLLDKHIQIADDELAKRKTWPLPTMTMPHVPVVNPPPWQPFPPDPLDPFIWRIPMPGEDQITYRTTCGGAVPQGEFFTSTIGGAS